MRRVDVFPPQGYQARARRDLDVLVSWLENTITRPSPQLGRQGPVCPFVAPALHADAIRFDLHYEVDGRDGAQMTDIIRSALRDFATTAEPTARSSTSLASRLVAFPDAIRDGWRRLDDIYRGLKDLSVAEGLMIGQFHPECDERAVRNPAFPVSRSPMALVAMRHMAPHDVLFLHEDRRWFEMYDARFGAHFRRGKVRDVFMRELYARALNRFPLESRVALPSKGEPDR